MGHGPLTFTDFDSREPDKAHDADWNDNVLALCKDVSDFEWMKYREDLSYVPKGSDTGKDIFSVYNIKKGQLYRFEELLKSTLLSHRIVVVFALIVCLGFLTYGFIRLSKFVEIFIPWEVISPFIPFEVAPEYAAHVYGIVFTLFAMFYAILGGMKSIVWADVLQYTIITFTKKYLGCRTKSS